MAKPSSAVLTDLRTFVAGLTPAQRISLHELLNYENTAEALWFVLDSQHEQAVLDSLRTDTDTDTDTEEGSIS